MRLILGSASPRRAAILAQIGARVDEVRPADIDETPRKGELPRAYCRRMAAEKLAAVPSGADELVLTADTTVALGRRILGKPADRAEAARFLQMLSGRRHSVITALAVRHGDRRRARCVVSAVKMKRLSALELEDYLDSGEWQGKAGGYAIQGRAEALVPWMSGSFSAVMGLPAAETAQILRAAGLSLAPVPA